MSPARTTEVVIIGAGIAGTAIARELSKYQTKVMLIEKAAEICFGSTKASTAIIHPGFPVAGAPLKTKFILQGNRMFEQLASELNISFKKMGELTVARNKNELESLKKLKDEGQAAGIAGLKIIDKYQLQKMEPNVTKDNLGALYASTAAIVLPFEVAIALAENASQNGVSILVDTEVIDLERLPNKHLLVKTNQGDLEAEFVVNAAGVFADEVASMVGANDFSIAPHKGEEYLLDNRVGNLINRPLFPMIDWSLIIPTVDGNIILGTTYTPAENRYDFATTSQGFKRIFGMAQQLVPALSPRDIIRSFAGLRGMNTRTSDYIIEPSKKEPRFINVVLGSPGITSAPAIAQLVVEILASQGLKLINNPYFNPQRRRIPRFSDCSEEQKKVLMAQDPHYSHVVCRCETVTEGEIIEAIRRGARTVDGVKYRTRAGMGRCQGGFCGPRVVQILARELNIPVTEVTKRGQNSHLLFFENKQLLRERLR